MYREILMDLNDMEGDAESGIKTLPVRLGKERAMGFACATMMAGTCGALVNLSSMGLADWVVGLLGEAGAWVVAWAVVVWATGQVAQQAAGVWRSGFDHEVVSRAIGGCLKPIGLGMILIAAVA